MARWRRTLFVMRRLACPSKRRASKFRPAYSEPNGIAMGQRLNWVIDQSMLLAAVVKLTVMAGENLTVGSAQRLLAESGAPGR